MSANRLWWLSSGCDTRVGLGWIRTSEGVDPADFLYASIQSEAIPRWAVLRSNGPAHTACGASSQADLSHGSSRAMFLSIGPKVRNDRTRHSAVFVLQLGHFIPMAKTKD